MYYRMYFGLINYVACVGISNLAAYVFSLLDSCFINYIIEEIICQRCGRFL